MKIMLSLAAAFLCAFGAFAQEPCMGSTEYNDAACYASPQPYCYNQANYCYDVPTMVNRYAYLADKYKTYGANERHAQIANGNQEAAELQGLDNYFNANSCYNKLNADQQLTLQTTKATVKH